MSIFNNTYPYFTRVSFNPYYERQVFKAISNVINSNLNESKREYECYHYKIIICEKTYEVWFRDLDKRYIREFMDYITNAVGHTMYMWNLYDTVNRCEISEFDIKFEQDNDLDKRMRDLKDMCPQYEDETDNDYFERLYIIANLSDGEDDEEEEY